MITVNKVAQLAAAKAERCDQVNAKLQELIDAGMNWQGNVFQIDAGSIAKMMEVMSDYLAGETDAAGGAWRSKANIMVPMTDDQVRALIAGARAYVKALRANSWALKDQINKLTTLADVEAFDITQGWPANNG